MTVNCLAVFFCLFTIIIFFCHCLSTRLAWLGMQNANFYSQTHAERAVELQNYIHRELWQIQMQTRENFFFFFFFRLVLDTHFHLRAYKWWVCVCIYYEKFPYIKFYFKHVSLSLSLSLFFHSRLAHSLISREIFFHMIFFFKNNKNGVS